MRHRVSGRKLSLNTHQRKALFKNLINALVIHGQIKTTEARAKAIRGLVEKLITKGKKQTLHARRLIAAFLQNNQAVNKVVDELAPLFKKREGGFTRIIRLGNRHGDNAPIVKIELVESPQVKPEEKKKPEKSEKLKVKKNENKSDKTK